MSILRNVDRLFLVAVVLCVAAVPAGAANKFVNGKIAFVSNRDNNFEIYVMNPDGSSQQRLTNDRAKDIEPAWSPDGTRIAFVRDGRIHLMNADGSGITLLGTCCGGRRPAWSPDGKRIAFDSNDEIFTIAVDGTDETQLTNLGGIADAPSWSPDGRSIVFAFAKENLEDRSIRIMNADGSEIRNLTADHRGSNNKPSFSPDGRQIVYTRNPSNWNVRSDIMIMNADGSDPQKLSTGAVYGEEHPVFSPDGTRIAFGGDPFFLYNTSIRTMDSDGSNEQKITEPLLGQDGNSIDDIFRDEYPSWQRAFAPETTGVYVPSTGMWLLRNSNSTGDPDIIVKFGGQPEDLPVAGDWDGDGRTDLAIFRGGTFIRARLTPPTLCIPCQTFTFVQSVDEIAFGEPGDLPMAGDWDGDGKDDIGVFRPGKIGTFLLRIPLPAPFCPLCPQTIFTTKTVAFGSAGQLPVAGDWNSDGKDEVGVFDPVITRFFLTEDFVDPTFIFLFGIGGDRPIAGDWLGRGVDSVGVFEPQLTTMVLAPEFTAPPNVFAFGVSEGLPVAGHWLPLGQ